MAGISRGQFQTRLQTNLGVDRVALPSNDHHRMMMIEDEGIESAPDTVETLPDTLAYGDDEWEVPTVPDLRKRVLFGVPNFGDVLLIQS